jgi:hypothetical protein
VRRREKGIRRRRRRRRIPFQVGAQLASAGGVSVSG